MNNNQSQMNLYIINDVLFDYTSGMCVIAAESKEQCREIFAENFKSSVKEYDECAEIKEIKNVDHVAGVVSYVYGGG
jgi:hypothetical protein